MCGGWEEEEWKTKRRRSCENVGDSCLWATRYWKGLYFLHLLTFLNYKHVIPKWITRLLLKDLLSLRMKGITTFTLTDIYSENKLASQWVLSFPSTFGLCWLWWTFPPLQPPSLMPEGTASASLLDEEWVPSPTQVNNTSMVVPSVCIPSQGASCWLVFLLFFFF